MHAISVRDVTWMSANGLHLCKWTVALIQATLRKGICLVQTETSLIHMERGFALDEIIALTIGAESEEEAYSLLSMGHDNNKLLIMITSNQ